MASAVPVPCSAYTYAYAKIGELIAWIIGWDLILEYAVEAVTVAIGWSSYFMSLLASFGIHLPKQFVSTPLAYDAAGHTWSTTGATLSVPAIAIIAAISASLVIGIRKSARFNVVTVAIKLVVIVIFIMCAAPMVDTSHWVTTGNPAGAFIPPTLVQASLVSGVIHGAAVVFFAFIGFDAVSTATQEAKNPKRDMPVGIWARSQSARCFMLQSLLSSPA
jgi:basic amino acid/polyamine antiporter, APA family